MLVNTFIYIVVGRGNQEIVGFNTSQCDFDRDDLNLKFPCHNFSFPMAYFSVLSYNQVFISFAVKTEILS